MKEPKLEIHIGENIVTIKFGDIEFTVTLSEWSKALCTPKSIRRS